MKRLARRAGCLLLAACLLSGCAALLERSYSVVEPYADRYWDSAAEDTLKAENYQDLVNSLLMQVEQRAEECVIRGYGGAAGYGQARSASREVRRETVSGSYLLENMTFDYEPSDGYSTFTFRMRYREDAEDIETMMSLSDCQSLVDLLRLSVREDHHRLTARFIRDMRREEVRAAVEALWQELCQGEKEDALPPPARRRLPPTKRRRRSPPRLRRRRSSLRTRTPRPRRGNLRRTGSSPRPWRPPPRRRSRWRSPPAPGPSASSRIWTARGSWRSCCRSGLRCNTVPPAVFHGAGAFFLKNPSLTDKFPLQAG